jgi:hypothetical protein
MDLVRRKMRADGGQISNNCGNPERHVLEQLRREREIVESQRKVWDHAYGCVSHRPKHLALRLKTRDNGEGAV